MNATYDDDRPAFSPFKLLFVLLVTVTFVILGMLAVAAPSYHAVLRHGESAYTVKQCLDQRGPLLDWVNASTGRHAQVCEVSPGKYGVDITESNGDSVTSILKDKMSNLNQVLQYLKNTGYLPPE
jgi:hypothetical protein